MAITLLFVLGFAILSYPSFSEFYNKRISAQSVSDYEIKVEHYDRNVYGKMFEQASLYNSMRGLEENTLVYTDCLNVQNGMMGYIEIPQIGISLPIFHGTSESILQKAVGHLEWTALPTGEVGNHTVLTGHTGLPSARLFTDIDQLGRGDTFQLKILDQVFHYKVTHTNVVEPDEVDLLQADPSKDLVTLLTCTPYGINSHRLLIHGERYTPTEMEEEALVQALGRDFFFIEVAFVTLLSGILLWFFLLKKRRT